MPRTWVWLQLLIGWLPIWVLFTVLIISAHGTPPVGAAGIALRMIVAAAVLGIGVYRLTARLPWPHPFQQRFIAMQVLAAMLYAGAWFALNSLIESLLHGKLVIELGPGLAPYLITGVWLYLIIAGVAYANRAAERATRIETLEARTQLAALRAQLHPHFLFNALHTVVQLIPIDPRGAARATEQLAGVLRTTVEEQRDLIPLADEWAFVQRYLEIESIRFGERLCVRATIDHAASEATVPSFALQTLVENAVRHAAAPRIERTEIVISASLSDKTLTLTVADNGAGTDAAQLAHAPGTGLRRLRERLSWLYGSRAMLELESQHGRGFSARLTLPQSNVPGPDRIRRDDD